MPKPRQTLETQKVKKDRVSALQRYGGGRPPKDPMAKMSISVRAMVTPVVTEVFERTQAGLGFPPPPQGRVASDLLRLALYRFMEDQVKKDPAVLGDMTWEEFANDSTWESLKMSGHV